MNNIAHLGQLCAKHRLTLTIKGCHYQIRGSILVNYYPESKKCVMYVAGTTKGVEDATAQMVVDAAMGKRLPGIPTQDRRKSYAAAKRKMHRRSPYCYWGQSIFCGYGKRALTLEEATTDHVIPLSRGGLNNPNNYVLSCQPCNHDKADALPKMVRA